MAKLLKRPPDDLSFKERKTFTGYRELCSERYRDLTIRIYDEPQGEIVQYVFDGTAYSTLAAAYTALTESPRINTYVPYKSSRNAYSNRSDDGRKKYVPAKKSRSSAFVKR